MLVAQTPLDLRVDLVRAGDVFASMPSSKEPQDCGEVYLLPNGEYRVFFPMMPIGNVDFTIVFDEAQKDANRDLSASADVFNIGVVTLRVGSVAIKGKDAVVTFDAVPMGATSLTF